MSVMKKCLVVVANPKAQSLTHTLASRFCDGIAESGDQYEVLDLFQDCKNNMGRSESVPKYQQAVAGCQGIVFVFPTWWEMPPYPLVEFLQTVFVSGFAFTHENNIKINKLDLKSLVITTRGQSEDSGGSDLAYLRAALEYSAMHSEDPLVCYGINPSTLRENVELYKNHAFSKGLHFFNEK